MSKEIEAFEKLRNIICIDLGFDAIERALNKLDKIELLLGRSELDPYEILCLIDKEFSDDTIYTFKKAVNKLKQYEIFIGEKKLNEHISSNIRVLSYIRKDDSNE